MPDFIPAGTNEEAWKLLAPHRFYAVRAPQDEDVHLRFGLSHGIYLSVARTEAPGRVINNIEFEAGNPELLGQLPENTTVVIGRVSECSIKILHAIVSRHHLELRLEGNILLLRDMGSTNGTYIHEDNRFFDIEEYIEFHPVEKPADSTLDEIHEAFGPELADFLTRFKESKKKDN